MEIIVLVLIGIVIYYIAKATGDSFEAAEKRLLKEYEVEIMGVNTVVEDTWRNFHKDVKKHEIRSQKFTDTAYGSREGMIALCMVWLMNDKKEMNEEWIWNGYYALAGLCFYGEYWQAYSLALALQRLDCERQGKWTLAAKAKNLQSYAAPLPTEKELFLRQDTGAVYKRFMEKDGDEFDEKDMKTGALLMWHYEEKDYQKASAVAQKMLDANKDALVETKLTKGVHELFYLKAAFAMQTRYGSQVQTPKLNDAEIKGFVAKWQSEADEEITNKVLAEGAYIVKYFLNAKEKVKALEYAEQLIKLEAKMGKNKADNDAAVVQDNSLNKQWPEGGFCRKCGAKMVEGGTFCVKCGTKAEVRGNMAQIDPFGFKKGLGTIIGEHISKYTAGLEEGVGYITSESNSGWLRCTTFRFLRQKNISIRLAGFIIFRIFGHIPIAERFSVQDTRRVLSEKICRRCMKRCYFDTKYCVKN